MSTDTPVTLSPCRFVTRLIRSWPLAMLLMLVGLIRFALVVVTVRNPSMAPTLNHGDRVLVLRCWPARWLRMGQIVLVCPPRPYRISGPQPFGFIPFIKRIVGLPGEIPVLPGSGLLDSNALNTEMRAVPQRTWRVPAGHLFVCGDNPRGSLDSRSWGPIPCQSVVGVMLMPLSRAAAPNQSDSHTTADIGELVKTTAP